MADDDKIELLALWLSDEGIYSRVNAGELAEPGDWGVILADVVRHIAEHFQKEEGRDPASIIQSIQKAFNGALHSEHGPACNHE